MESLFVECAVRAALIAVVTAAVLSAIGIKPAAARHTAWTGVLLTMLLLPIWTAWGPKTPVRLLPPVEFRGTIETPAQSVFPSSVRLTEVRQLQAPVPPPSGQNWTWENLLLLVYASGAFALLARLAIGTAQTHRLRSRANVRDGQGISSECTSPVTVGWLHPVVILPKNWQQWSPPQLDAVLTHEREHVRRRDPLIQWLALVNRALFWFHPLSWWLEQKLSVLAEEACDAAVLARGHSPQNYSEYLLDIARFVARSGSRLSIVGMAMHGGLLQQRIRQILSPCGALPTSRTRIAIAVAACASSSALLASGTLDHARTHVPPVASRPVAAPILPTAGMKPEVAPAAQAPENPRVLLAQAAAGPIPSNPPAPPSQTAGAAPPPDSAAKEKQLQDAFLSSDPITDMAIAMEINYFQLNRAEYLVPLTVKIPGSELGLARNGGAEQTSFDFLYQVKDEFGAVVQNKRDKVSINLNGAMAAQLASTPVEYDAASTLLPGRYSIKLLARNNETGRIGTYQTVFTVPNLNKEQQGIPISSVVLSSQRVEMADAINADNRLQTANPLVADGRKLIPSVTRVFSKSREMYVYLQAYQREAGNTQPLVASAAFYQGSVKVLETAPIEVTQGTDSKSRAVPLSLSISLADLKPGEYTCQITVRSPSTQKTALWQAPVVIEP
ncbi:MAG TPA: M56 family metallopeptidase [Bryobacteraceae bacterium]|nr:M56 family metallopeptidase [Bryobacteraceae bacterium]